MAYFISVITAFAVVISHLGLVSLSVCWLTAVLNESHMAIFLLFSTTGKPSSEVEHEGQLAGLWLTVAKHRRVAHESFGIPNMTSGSKWMRKCTWH